MLAASSTTAYLASLGLAAVAENDKVAQRLREQFNEIYQ
jgi:hypothetical protein